MKESNSRHFAAQCKNSWW